MQHQVSALPPFGLWLVGLLYILETVNLRLPRFSWVGLLSVNDVLDGLVVPLACAWLARKNFGAVPFGLSSAPFSLLCLRMIGSGMHACASAFNAAVMADAVPRPMLLALSSQFHQLSHWLGQIGELGLLACLVWLASPKLALAEDAGLEMPGHIIASVHGLVAGTHAVSTKTIPALAIVWIMLAWMVWKRSKALVSSMMRYAFLFSACSFAFVVVWGAMHNGTWPTFEDVNAANAAMAAK